MTTIPVSLIHAEDGDDLIVSFAIPTDQSWNVRSLTLIRDVKYESLLPSDERGVHVSDDEADPAHGGDYLSMLQELRWEGHRVHLRCTAGRTWELDVSEVEPEEATEARRILRAMNRDKRFRLHLKPSGS